MSARHILFDILQKHCSEKEPLSPPHLDTGLRAWWASEMFGLCHV